MKKTIYYLVLLALWLVELLIFGPLVEDNLVAGLGLLGGMVATLFIWNQIYKQLKLLKRA